jgi:hypothetical protein
VSNFRVRVGLDRSRWPFRWGPFGGKTVVELEGLEGLVEIYQRDRHAMVLEPVMIDLHQANDQLLTVVGVDDRVHFRRSTRLLFTRDERGGRT